MLYHPLSQDYPKPYCPLSQTIPNHPQAIPPIIPRLSQAILPIIPRLSQSHTTYLHCAAIPITHTQHTAIPITHTYFAKTIPSRICTKPYHYLLPDPYPYLFCQINIPIHSAKSICLNDHIISTVGRLSEQAGKIHEV